jgi:hypothetical protein
VALTNRTVPDTPPGFAYFPQPVAVLNLPALSKSFIEIEVESMAFRTEFTNDAHSAAIAVSPAFNRGSLSISSAEKYL